jgi:hypothetical protein
VDFSGRFGHLGSNLPRFSRPEYTTLLGVVLARSRARLSMRTINPTSGVLYRALDCSIYAPGMASAELGRRVEKVVGYPPLSELNERQRREFHEALLDADSFEDLPGKWQAAILKAEQNRPKH